MKYLVLIIISLYVSTIKYYGAERLNIEDVELMSINRDIMSLGGVKDEYSTISYWCSSTYLSAILSPNNRIKKHQYLLGHKRFIPLVISVQRFTKNMTINFEERIQVKEKLKAEFIDNNGQAYRLKMVDNDLVEYTSREVIKSFMRSASLSQAFVDSANSYVFENIFNDSGEPLVDPYMGGILRIEYSNHEIAKYEFPFKSLYVIKKSSNLREIDPSWLYNPWTGKEIK
jgi:hypothetical protein